MLPEKVNIHKLLLLTCITVVFLLLRHKYHFSALETDEGSYAYMAQEILRGNVPYVDFFDHKPPIIYLIYTLVIGVFGFDTVLIKVSATVASLVSAFFVYKIAQSLFDTRYAILAYALLLFSLTLPFIQASTANTEIFLLVFVLAGIYILLTRNTLRWTFIAGALFGIAILTKTIAVTNIAAVLLFLILRKEYQRIKVVFLGSGIVIISPIVYYFFLGGTQYVADYWFANVTYNSLYLKQPTFVERFYRFPLEIIRENIMLWLLGLSGIFSVINDIRGRIRITRLFITTNIVFSLLLIQYIGHAWPHYYIQLIPFFVLMGVYFIREVTITPLARMLLLCLALISLSISVFIYCNTVGKVPTERLLTQIFGSYGRGAWYDESVGLSEYISTHTKPGDYIYNIGRESQIYAYTGTRSSSKYYYDRPIWVGANVFSNICEDLKDNPPVLLVDTLLPPEFEDPVFSHFKNRILECTEINIDKTERIGFAEIHLIATD